MQNAERISPRSKRLEPLRAAARSLPYCSSTSALPVSGALQLNTCGARNERPISSASGAYSALVRPGAPYSASGRKRFHRPASRALALSSSTTGSTTHGSSAPGSARVAYAGFPRLDLARGEVLLPAM